MDHVTDKRVRIIRQLAEAGYEPSQTIETDGYKLRIVHVSLPNSYRDYAILDLEPLQKGLVPARKIATFDEKGLHFRVPEGWRRVQSREEGA